MQAQLQAPGVCQGLQRPVKGRDLRVGWHCTVQSSLNCNCPRTLDHSHTDKPLELLAATLPSRLHAGVSEQGCPISSVSIQDEQSL